jgi:hypothetical protein
VLDHHRLFESVADGSNGMQGDGITDQRSCLSDRYDGGIFGTHPNFDAIEESLYRQLSPLQFARRFIDEGRHGVSFVDGKNADEVDVSGLGALGAQSVAFDTHEFRLT